MARIAPPLDEGSARRAFGRVARFNGTDRPGHRHWSVRARDSGDRIGIVGLLRTGADVELGGLLLPEWWNRRVSREAYGRVIQHAFETPGIDLVFGERPDDDHARIIDRLFAPLGLARVTGKARAPDACRWELSRWKWAARP